MPEKSIEVVLTEKHLKILAAFEDMSNIRSLPSLDPNHYMWDDRAGMIYDPENKLIPHYQSISQEAEFKQLIEWAIIGITPGGVTWRLNHPSRWGHPVSEPMND